MLTKSKKQTKLIYAGSVSDMTEQLRRHPELKEPNSIPSYLLTCFETKRTLAQLSFLGNIFIELNIPDKSLEMFARQGSSDKPEGVCLDILYINFQLFVVEELVQKWRMQRLKSMATELPEMMDELRDTNMLFSASKVARDRYR